MGKKSKRESMKQARPGGGSSDSIEVHDVFPKLQINDRVVLLKLSNEQYNGKFGTVESLPKPPLDSKSRYGILVDGSEKAVGIQAKNLLQVFQIGDRVSLRGLASKGYNGSYGTVVKVPESFLEDDPRYGIRLDGKDNAIGIRVENIHLLNRMTTQQQREAREHLTSSMEPSEGESLDADQLAMMRMMTNMLLSEEQQIKVYGRKIVPIPDFHQELFAEGLPESVDRSWANGYLRLAYEQASGLPHNFETAMKSDQYKPQPSDIVKRL